MLGDSEYAVPSLVGIAIFVVIGAMVSFIAIIEPVAVAIIVVAVVAIAVTTPVVAVASLTLNAIFKLLDASLDIIALASAQAVAADVAKALFKVA